MFTPSGHWRHEGLPVWGFTLSIHHHHKSSIEAEDWRIQPQVTAERLGLQRRDNIVLLESATTTTYSYHNLTKIEYFVKLCKSQSEHPIPCDNPSGLICRQKVHHCGAISWQLEVHTLLSLSKLRCRHGLNIILPSLASTSAITH